MKKENEEIIVEILKERIKENEELFNKKEINLFNDNIKSIKKNIFARINKWKTNIWK